MPEVDLPYGTEIVVDIEAGVKRARMEFTHEEIRDISVMLTKATNTWGGWGFGISKHFALVARELDSRSLASYEEFVATAPKPEPVAEKPARRTKRKGEPFAVAE